MKYMQIILISNVDMNLKESQCIRATLNPGNVNKDPIRPHHTAMKNLITNLDAGPL